jgi:hypothetical protein
MPFRNTFGNISVARGTGRSLFRFDVPWGIRLLSRPAQNAPYGFGGFSPPEKAVQMPTGCAHLDAVNNRLIRQELSSADANRLRKWASVWTDLTHVRQVLYERAQLSNTGANVFLRRALWESATASYGRMGASEKRKVDFQTFVNEVGGSAAKRLHEELMLWRHEHVAHRTGAEYEETVAEVYFDDQGVNHLNVVVSTSIGPPDENDLPQRFQDYVDKLRDHLWENYMAPWGKTLAERARESGPPTESAPQANPREDRIGLSLTLWDQVHGVGLAEPPKG